MHADVTLPGIASSAQRPNLRHALQSVRDPEIMVDVTILATRLEMPQAQQQSFRDTDYIWTSSPIRLPLRCIRERVHNESFRITHSFAEGVVTPCADEVRGFRACRSALP